MNFLKKIAVTVFLIQIATLGHADTANDIINRVSDKISSIVSETLGGDTEFSLEFPENGEVNLELLKFKELDSSENQNSFSKLLYDFVSNNYPNKFKSNEIRLGNLKEVKINHSSNKNIFELESIKRKENNQQEL